MRASTLSRTGWPFSPRWALSFRSVLRGGKAGALNFGRYPTVEDAARVALRTTSETGLQIKPREARQQALQVLSAETLPLALQFNTQVPVEFSSPTANRITVEVSTRFAPETGSGVTFRTTLGTVPGTVPTVVPGRSVLTVSTAPKTNLFGYLRSLELTWPLNPPP